MNSIRRTEKERLERIEKQAELIGTQAEKIKELTSQVSEQNAYIKELESKSAKLNK